ncbi:hypothetical protein [Rhodopseudomonas pseudopalustris]|uniref:hypothetical protein n=1 Tax=Rhodopseudomonas pseudopalustris TaxID=1513892 RepID=UPI0015880DCF
MTSPSVPRLKPDSLIAAPPFGGGSSSSSSLRKAARIDASGTVRPEPGNDRSHGWCSTALASDAHEERMARFSAAQSASSRST